MDLTTLPANTSTLLRITAIRDEAPEIKTFFLETTDGQPLSYKAGQFLTFIFNRHGHEERRSYSVSSSPAANDPLAITVKRVENGAHSRWLIDHAKVGDELRTTGASGLFTLPGQPEVFPQLFLFAAGIGITPIYSMLKDLLYGNAPVQIVLFYSNRSKEVAVFRDELLTLEARFPKHLKIEWRYSDAKNLLRARMSKATIPALIRENMKVPATTLLAYICGPEDYRWLLTLLLEEAGIPLANIRKEIFLPGRMPIAALPSDTEAHTVTIRLKGQHYTLTVQYPETILSAAKKQGIALPYSCEAGRCASCIAKCTRGKVWMAYNEVLTEADLSNGLVLTCTGYPVDGDVDLYLA